MHNGAAPPLPSSHPEGEQIGLLASPPSRPHIVEIVPSCPYPTPWLRKHVSGPAAHPEMWLRQSPSWNSQFPFLHIITKVSKSTHSGLLMPKASYSACRRKSHRPWRNQLNHAWGKNQCWKWLPFHLPLPIGSNLQHFSGEDIWASHGCCLLILAHLSEECRREGNSRMEG